MCTAVCEWGKHPILGRTLDLDRSYGEQVVIAPRGFSASLIKEGGQRARHAILGVAHMHRGRPLFYDALNDCGLCMAGLNFPHFTVYHPPKENKRNVASFEMIPWVLENCADLAEARLLLSSTNVVPDSISGDLPATPLHWLVADKRGALAVESTVRGLEVHENPFGVLTNAPDFHAQAMHAAGFLHLVPEGVVDKPLLCSNGTGAIGLPGDWSSPSRFVRAFFAKTHTVMGDIDPTMRMLHVMQTVAQPEGCTVTEEGKPIRTVYTVCADLASLCYAWTTYGCSQLQRVCLRDVDLDSSELYCYAMETHKGRAHPNGISPQTV